MKKLATMIVACAAIIAAARAIGSGYDPEAPWPVMRGDYKNTGRAGDVHPSRIEDLADVPIWEFQTNGPIFSTPVVGADGTVYIGSADYVFYAIDPGGELKWSYRTERLIDSAAALSDDGTVYVPGGDGYVYALEAETGRLLWKFEARNIEEGRVEMADWFEGNVTMSPGGLALAPNDDFCLYGIEPDGSMAFESCAGGIIWSAIPTDDQGRHFFCSLDMSCYGVDSEGNRLWKSGTWGILSSSPAIGPDGTVYAASFDGKLYAFDPDTGKKKWSFKTGDHVYASAAIGEDGMVYISSCDGTLYALRDLGGRPEVVWAYDTLDPIRSSPVIDGDGNIYFGDGDGNLIALGPGGKRRWSMDLTINDENDINASMALGEKSLYLALQDGRVMGIPYDYCLNHDDGRCVAGSGEGLPEKGEFIYWMTPGGSSLPMDETVAGVLPGNVITLRLVVRDGGDTIVAGVDKDTVKVEVDPWFPHHVSVSMDHRFVNIVPDGPVGPGREYKVRVSGKYREPGIKVLGHIWITAGKVLGDFDEQVSFRTMAIPERAGMEGAPLLFTHMSFYQPLIFPSVAQIGMDDMNYIITPVEEVEPSVWTGWLMVAWPDAAGVYSPEPGHRVSFPVHIRYEGGLITLWNRGSAFDHAGNRFDWRLFRANALVEKEGEDRSVSINSLYGEGEKMSTSGLFYDFPAFGTPLVGALHVNEIELPAAPEGFELASMERRGKKIVAVVNNRAGLKAAEHHLGVMVVEQETGEPVLIGYDKAASTTANESGEIVSGQVELPLSCLGKKLKAYAILDGIVIGERDGL